MREILASLTAAILLLAAPTASTSAPYFRVLAPAEESFMGAEDVLIIGKVEGFVEAKMVEISDNGKTLGFAPLQKETFTFKTRLSEGRHEVVLAAPGVERKTIRIFIGKQTGYRYHIDIDPGACDSCHDQAASKVFAVGPMQQKTCAQCHDPMATREFVHGPVAAGSCTPCHDAHGSKYGKFLVATGKELCLSCHSQNLSRKHIEERQNAECVKCHDPHSSAKNYHLR